MSTVVLMGVKILLAVFWLLIVPLMIGEDLAAGYAILFAVTELLAVPMIFAGAPLHLLAIAYTVVIAGLFVILRVVPDKGVSVRARIRECPQKALEWLKDGSWVLWIALFVIAYQMVVMSQMIHIDADDSFYVGQAVTDLAKNSVYRYEPYTGNLYPYLPGRYTLSPFPAHSPAIADTSPAIRSCPASSRSLASSISLIRFSVIPVLRSFSSEA